MNFRRSTSRLSLILFAAGCGQKSDPAPQAAAAPPSSVTKPEATESSSPPAAPSLSDVPATPRSPWSEPKIPASSIPRVYLEVWRSAENKSRCALLAPVALSADVAAATPRKATFSGGWSVAYDLPGTRSAFGIAGSGSDAWAPETYARWPQNISWSDGSSAGYGPEAGTGPNWLAYVKIPGQQCLYNVWSRRGQRHLEQVIQSLRFVAEDSD